MLTIETILKIPEFVSFTYVQDDAVLLNTRTNQYYRLDDVGARFWSHVENGKTIKEACCEILEEYAVEQDRLEQDILELIEEMSKHGLVEVLPP
jgi:hypothetical protein